jgi:hypothetical protein
MENSLSYTRNSQVKIERARSMPARIVEAMYELKERRDMGELVHQILEEVAVGHAVSVAELRKRAELSWGIPLETDRDRHSAHFELMANAKNIAVQARKLARTIYDANLPYIKDFYFWEVNWEREIDQALEKAKIDPELEPIARKHFLVEAERLEESLERMRRAAKTQAT